MSFDPNKYLINLKGKDYLEVKYRIAWMRDEHKDWSVTTEITHLGDGHAICKAVIRNEMNVILATAHKREDHKHFPDYMEKAETGAIGRALAICGYGTQFTGGELDEGERIVDAPVAKPSAKGQSFKLERDPVEDLLHEIMQRMQTLTDGYKDKEKLALLKAEIGVDNSLELRTKSIAELTAISMKLGKEAGK